MEHDADDPVPFERPEVTVPFRQFKTMWYLFVISFPTFSFWYIVWRVL